MLVQRVLGPLRWRRKRLGQVLPPRKRRAYRNLHRTRTSGQRWDSFLGPLPMLGLNRRFPRNNTIGIPICQCVRTLSPSLLHRCRFFLQLVVANRPLFRIKLRARQWRIPTLIARPAPVMRRLVIREEKSARGLPQHSMMGRWSFLSRLSRRSSSGLNKVHISSSNNRHFINSSNSSKCTLPLNSKQPSKCNLRCRFRISQ